MKNLLLGRHHTTVAQDVILLLVRVGVGAVLIAHGWQKLDENGFAGTSGFFESLGIPLPDVAAGFAIAVELGGGALLVLGALTPVVGLLVVANMAGAFWYAHRTGGVFVGDGGWELVLVIGLVGLALVAAGAGRLSVDRLLGGPAPSSSPSTPASA